MAPFTLASLSETFTILMNTPLVPADSSRTPRDVPLTEMPTSNRQSRETRRQSTSSATTASSHSSTSPSDIPDERWAYSGSLNSHISRPRTPTPVLAASSKNLPPLPAGSHHSRVHFADDVNAEL